MSLVPHAASQECRDSFLPEFEKASQAGKWLAAIFYIGEDGKVHYFRTSCEFPTGSFADVVGLMKSDFEQEFRAKLDGPDNSPLPLAPHLLLDKKIQTSQAESFERGEMPECAVVDENGNPLPKKSDDEPPKELED